MKKKNAFTLIGLIAVLVILAILALIVTPLVMNIIKKTRVSADKRSIDAYLPTTSTPEWVHHVENNYDNYWTMSSYDDSSVSVWVVCGNDFLTSDNVYEVDYYGNVVRPVITIKKKALES